MSAEYRPGTCNIGRQERRLRYGFGAAGFVVAALLVAAIPVLDLPRWGWLAAALPLFGGFVGLLQGREAFCVRYAMAGVYNVSSRLGEQVSITEKESIRRDRRRARRLLARAAGYTAVVTVAVYGIGTHVLGP